MSCLDLHYSGFIFYDLWAAEMIAVHPHHFMFPSGNVCNKMLYVPLEGRAGEDYESLDMVKGKLLWHLLIKLAIDFGGNSLLPLIHSLDKKQGKKNEPK